VPAATAIAPPSSAATRFTLLGIGSNALLELIDRARHSRALWDAIPLVMGSAPNVFAVPAIAFTVIGIVSYMPRDRVGMHRDGVRRIVVAATVVGLIAWEAIQRGSRNMRFDWSDILATLVAGAVCAAVIPFIGGARVEPPMPDPSLDVAPPA
jgi:hypothetical protein